MDENTAAENDSDMNNCDNNDVNKNKNNEGVRIETDPAEEGTSNNSINVQEVQTAGTSIDNNCSSTTRTRNKNHRNRHYRNSNMEDSSANESVEEEPVVNEDNNTDSTFSFEDFCSTSHCSTSTLNRETDTDSETEVPQALKKQKPLHSWYVVPEVLKRQFGYSSKLHSAELFRNQCYGSLHCVQRLELMYKLEEHLGCVNSLNFYPDGSLLASGSDDLCIVVWDWKIGKCLLKYRTKHRSNVLQSKFLHINGDLHIVSCSRDGQVRLARLSKEGAVRENRKLGIHSASCHKLAVLPDQPHIILSAGEDGVVLSHDIRKTKPDQVVHVKIDGRAVPLYSIDRHPLKTHEFCVSGQDDVVRIYDQRKTDSPFSTCHPFKKTETNHYRGLHVTSAVYNFDGQEILASYNDADIYLFDVNSPPGEYVHKYEGHRNGATIKGVNFYGPKSEFIVSGSDCGNIFFWEKNTEAIVQCMPGDDSGVVNCLEPHPHLPFICTSGLDWDVKVWVPSCETEPSLETLPQIIKKNKKARNTLGLASEAPVLWMLWQHLRRSSSSVRRRELREMNFDSLELGPIDGLDDDDDDMNETVEDDEDEEDDEDGDNSSVDFATECTTS